MALQQAIPKRTRYANVINGILMIAAFSMVWMGGGHGGAPMLALLIMPFLDGFLAVVSVGAWVSILTLGISSFSRVQARHTLGTAFGLLGFFIIIAVLVCESANPLLPVRTAIPLVVVACLWMLRTIWGAVCVRSSLSAEGGEDGSRPAVGGGGSSEAGV